MEKKQKKQVKKYISWVLIVAIVALLAFLPVIASQEETASGPQASILSAKAELRDITTVVLGGGSLSTEEAQGITIPAAVKVKEYLVSNGDLVTEGQSVAAVDRVSVMTAISQVQETLDYLTEEINEIRSETASEMVEATAGGRVKYVYAEVGETVQDVMLRDGALAVLSLDGLMAVQVERNTDLAGGDAVCVILSDGTEVDGRVESNLEGILTVTVEDDGFAPGEEVRIEHEDGDRIGSGQLYIHSPWKVVAYSGTVSQVRVTEGQTVKAGYTLFRLKDTGHSARFDDLSRQHREYENLMLELFKMYQSETITAPADGMITGVDVNGAYMLADNGAGWKITLLANAPNGDDESTYVNYIGQVAEIGIDGLVLKMNPQPLAVTDYKDLSALPMDPSLMSEDAIYAAGAPIYELADGEWVQINAASIVAGDILLFAGDAQGNFVWVVRVGKGTVQPDNPGDTDPTDPDQPDKPGTTDPEQPDNPPGTDAPTEPGTLNMPTQPTDPTTPATPSGPTGDVQMGGSFPQGGGSIHGFSGGVPQEEAFELYGLETVTIASVTPQQEATIQITVDELDISKIYVGQEATVTVEALAGQKFEGAVTFISSSGENEGGNSKFTVEVTVAKTADMLPGMSASVSLPVDSVQQVMCIPVAALMEKGSETPVYTGYNEAEEIYINPVTVTTGVSDGEFVQIMSGLQEGDSIYYPYYDTLEISFTPESGGGFLFR